jgi:DNA-binding Lrp family transcriptional regulator
MDDLLKILKENARQSVDFIAAQLKTTGEAVSAKIKEYEEKGVIRGYQAILNEEQLKNRRVTALIQVKVVPQREGGFNSTAERIANFPEVTSLYLMSGEWDLLLFVEGDDLGKVAAFVSERLSSIPGVTGTNTHFMLKTFKHRGVLMRVPDSHERLQVSP